VLLNKMKLPLSEADLCELLRTATHTFGHGPLRHCSGLRQSLAELTRAGTAAMAMFSPAVELPGARHGPAGCGRAVRGTCRLSGDLRAPMRGPLSPDVALHSLTSLVYAVVL
jgi:hypothetical protein